MRRCARALLVIFATCAMLCSPLYARCSPNTVIVKGHIRNAPRGAKVRVVLLYTEQAGESGDVIPIGAGFTLQIPFLTESRPPLLVGSFRQKCDRKPKTVLVTLLVKDPSGDDQEYDRVSLDFSKDFTQADASAYSSRAEVTLDGAHSSRPQ